ncbi:SphA family protein [Pseudomonas sp. LRF_L74]|uniref:SphA family protein n=1 Tax=Pseudomonas sp. LRF_L74 TaxID=3369422 RepID=UPI003F6053A1
MRFTLQRHLSSAVLLSLLAIGQSAHATEGGGGAYANGSEGFMTGALPPPGTYLVSYNTYYSADTFANSNPAFDDFKVNTAATILRAIHVTDKQILGGNWAMHAFLVAADVDVDMGAGGRQDRAGLGDFIFDPLAIGWHSGNWHWIVGLDIYLPTGRYDKDELSNIGRNYVTLEPLFAFTYRNAAGYEFSMKTMFDHNYENSDTDYRSGNELHADFVAAKHFGNWGVGIGGYTYKQVSGDSGEGAMLGDFKGRATALGPQLTYTSASGLNIQGRYQHEFDVQNRPEGDKFWLNVAIPL